MSAPLRFAYADPPYVGQAKRHYAHDDRGEVNHAQLLQRLHDEFPDGWALSCSTPSLDVLLVLCIGIFGAGNVRVGAWVKPFCAFKPNVNPAYAWEPVVFRGGRKRPRTEPTVRDWVSANITLKKGLSGAKPVGFCEWLFDLLGMQPGDELHDLYPGTGIVSETWNRWCDGRSIVA